MHQMLLASKGKTVNKSGVLDQNTDYTNIHLDGSGPFSGPNWGTKKREKPDLDVEGEQIKKSVLVHGLNNGSVADPGCYTGSRIRFPD